MKRERGVRNSRSPEATSSSFATMAAVPSRLATALEREASAVPYEGEFGRGWAGQAGSSECIVGYFPEVRLTALVGFIMKSPPPLLTLVYPPNELLVPDFW